MAQDKEYELIDKKKLDSLVSKKGYEFFTQLSFNYAYVYRKGEKYALFPQQGKNGIIYYSKSRYDRDVIEKTFPVDEPALNNFDRDKNLIKNFEFNVIIDRFIDKGYVDRKDDYNYEDLEKLTDTIKKLKLENSITENDYYELGFFLAECFRKKINGGWKLTPEFSFNLYWLPNVVDEKGRIYGTRFWKDVIEQNKYLDLNNLMLMELADYNGLQVLSKEHAEFLKGKW